MEQGDRGGEAPPSAPYPYADSSSAPFYYPQQQQTQQQHMPGLVQPSQQPLQQPVAPPYYPMQMPAYSPMFMPGVSPAGMSPLFSPPPRSHVPVWGRDEFSCLGSVTSPRCA
eukprot:TRINITY_DN2875_c0_g1_i1.p2 TRINITY_DN2875_c0_g1~~TRINITY_DN2875_c0_g1_i1.p2  ORF type:complete len:112 (-),score=5.31 TRINITY_DN2875_c0_g1_i1:226-561(-)